MKKKIILHLLLLICYHSFIFAQQTTNPLEVPKAEGLDCGQTSLHALRMKTDPEYAKKSRITEEAYYKYAKDWIYENRNTRATDINSRLANPRVMTIPVVVHVMYLTGTTLGTSENISDAQVQAGIQHLNDAFAKLAPYNTGPLFSNAGIGSADIEIQFCLATLDPSGNATTGITRHTTTYSNLYRDDIVSVGVTQDGAMKALAYWNSSQYLNIYTVKEIYQCSSTAAAGGSPYVCPVDQGVGIAGYAYFAGAHGQTYDGVVNEAAFFGSSTNNSKVHIHEVGHYFNLAHTFQNGCEAGDCYSTGDNVCDTPPDNSQTSVSCASNATANTCSNDATLINSPFLTDVQDIYEDYMDYGFQSCQNTFTPGQKSRMRQALFTTRQSLLTSGKCGSVNTWVDATLNSVTSPATGSLCSSTFTPQISVSNGGNTTITAMVITATFAGGSPVTNNWTGTLNANGSTTISLSSMTLPTNAAYSLTIQITSVNGQGIDTYEDNNNLSFSVGPSINQTMPTAACAIIATNTGTLNSGFGMGIYNVTLGTINHTTAGTYSEGAVYFDRVCSQTTTLSAANSAISVTVGSLNTERVKVFVDLNNNGAFTANEHLLTMRGTNTLTGVLPIPCTGATFNTLLRMRVVSDFTNNTAVACTTPEYGQVEDYGIIIPSNIFSNTAPTAACATFTDTNLGTGSSFDTGIKNVTFNTINYSSPSAFSEGKVYFDRSCAIFTTFSSPTVNDAVTASMSVTVGSLNNENVKVFIDLNNNGTFDSGESFFNQTGQNTLSTSITLPNTVTRNTLLRMRVISEAGTVSNGCTTPTYGQVEDYGIIIQTALPVELLDFTAVNKADKNILNWQTATEINNNHFVVQKSKDGQHFVDIGTVKGGGTTTTPQYYAFTDDSPYQGINYYRLKQVDNEEKEDFSKIVSVTLLSEGKKGLALYPNPTHNVLTVEHTPSVQSFEIVNTLGQVLKVVKPLLDANKTEIGTTELANGIYFLRINQTEMMRFTKL